jgi:phosphopantothenoylcysteine decarboxylase/phosphopantothenate--cysteine ligase
VAPASADFIARLTQGRADDLLTAVCLASEAPLALAPAMNRLMWQDAATRENCLTLRRRGVRLFGPAEGSQACGETGPGRMLEPGDIALRTAALFESGALTGQKVIITAGPTLEDIDPVRYIGNRSSGKMGYALAAAAAEAGAEVVLISGPTSLEPPPRVTLIKVRSAQQMLEAVESQLDDCQVFIAAAAVADYRPRLPATEKFKRSADTLTLQLEPTPDILSSVVRYGDVFTVGFAAETGDVVSLGEAKLLNKQVDMLVANRVGQDDAGQSVGFENDNNEVHVMWQGGSRHFPRQRKGKLAVQLIALITERYHAKQDSAQSA